MSSCFFFWSEDNLGPFQGHNYSQNRLCSLLNLVSCTNFGLIVLVDVLQFPAVLSVLDRREVPASCDLKECFCPIG